jgi:hypothetical protein
MPRKAIGFDTVRGIGFAFPEVEESRMYGAPALKVHGRLLACIPSHRSAEPDSLAVRADFDDRAELLAEAPDAYYVTDHYLCQVASRAAFTGLRDGGHSEGYQEFEFTSLRH